MLCRSLGGAQTAGLCDDDIRRIHISGYLPGKAQDPETGVLEFDHGLIELFIVTADSYNSSVFGKSIGKIAG